MNQARRTLISIGCFALLFIAAFVLQQHGLYGWTLFVLLPVIAGGLCTWSFRPTTAGKTARLSATIGAVECALFLLLGVEGFVCVLMAIPVVIPLTMAGGFLAYWGGGKAQGKRPVAMGLFVPLCLLFDVNAKPPVYSVSTSIVVNAPPERVWKFIPAFPEITEKPDWVLRTGVAYPIRSRLEGSGLDVPRNCDLSTGTVKERVVVWDAPRLLRFIVTATPPAMKEMGLYGPIYPRHLNGYYISSEGQFELTPLPGGRTLVVGTSWYRHGLWPAEYWRLWSDLVVRHIHRRVLEHIRALSELPSPQKY
jgi:Polyketide cyclase / dehydrase and lipid transport